jgi:hypothetical protein
MSVDPSIEVLAIRFLLEADISPGLLPRLLQPFAKRDLVPSRLASYCTGTTMYVEIRILAMPIEMTHLIEGNLQQIVGVRRVIRD